MGRCMEIAPVGSAPRDLKNNAPAPDILYTITVFARHYPLGNMDAKRGRGTGRGDGGAVERGAGVDAAG